MAIALRGTPQSGINTGGVSVSVSVPTGVVNGDLLIAAITGFKSSGSTVPTPNTPTGFTSIGTAQSSIGTDNNTVTGLYYRIASSEPASYTLSLTLGSGDNYIDADIVAYSGVSTTSPFNLTSLSATGNGTSSVSTDLGSTTVDNCWHVIHYAAYGGYTAPSLTGYTQDLFYDGDSISYHKLITPAGATGAKTQTTGGATDGWVVWALALQPPTTAAVGGVGAQDGTGLTPLTLPGASYSAMLWQPPLVAIGGQTTQALQQSLAAGLSFTGSGPVKAVSKGLTAAALTFTGSQLRSTAKQITAALSFTASGPTRALVKTMSGALSFTGTQSRALSKGLAAQLSFTGSVTKAVVKTAFSAAVSFTGSLTSSHVLLKALSAGLSFTGSQTRQISKGVSATLTFTGSGPLRAVAKGISAALSFTGSRRIALVRSLSAASLSFTGSVVSSHVLLKALNATLSFTGSTTRQTAKGLSASLSFSGSLARGIGKQLAAALGFLAGLVASSSGGTVQTLPLAILTRSGALLGRTRDMVVGIITRSGSTRGGTRG